MGKRVAVVGTGPAGLTAAWSLAKSHSNLEIVVYERNSWVGGRTKSEHFPTDSTEPHILDTGAGWFTSFYSETFKLMEQLGLSKNLKLRTRVIRGASELLTSTNPRTSHPLPLTKELISSSKLLNEEEKKKLQEYLMKLLNLDFFDKLEKKDASNDLLAMPLHYFDKKSSKEEYSFLGENVITYVMGPLFEGPFFCNLDQLSSSMTNSWLRALLDPSTEFYQVNAGMDSICKALYSEITNKYSHCVRFCFQYQVDKIQFKNENNPKLGVRVYSTNHDQKIKFEKDFDEIILAIPSVEIPSILPDNFENHFTKVIKEIIYTPHVRIYAARKSSESANFGYHLVPTVNSIATIEFFSSDNGAWGNCPPGYQWGLVCATSSASAEYVNCNLSDKEIIDQLWNRAKEILPELFSLEEAEIIHIVRWKHAIPVLGKNTCSVIKNYKPEPPIIFAGDWSLQPCVEGAIRSGKRAASAVLQYSNL